MRRSGPHSPSANLLPPSRAAFSAEPTEQRPFSWHTRRLARYMMAAVGAALALAALVVSASAWQQTRLREAYLPDLEVMAQRSPHDGRLLALLGGRLMEAGELDAAADTLHHAIAAGDDADEVWLSLAATNAARGQQGAAQGDLVLMGRIKGETPALQAAQARIADLPALPPNAPKAEADAALTQALCPQGPQAILATHAAGSFLNGAFEWWGRRHAETSGYATRLEWVHQQPEDAQALRLWGLALERNRRLTEAGLALKQAVAKAPSSPAAHLAMAGFLEKVAPPAKAGMEYIACLKLRPNWLPALLGLGRVGSMEHTKYEAASYKRATEVAPDSADAWIGLGRAYGQVQSDYDKSLAAFETAARLAPDRSDFFASYADVLRNTNQWDASEAMLRRRLKVAPEDAFCRYLLGLVLRDSHPTPDREAEAEVQTRESLQLAPHTSDADNQLAEMLLERGDARGAVALLQDSLSADPYSLNTLNILARAYRENGQTSQAALISARARAFRTVQERKSVLSSQEHEKFLDVPLHEELAILYRKTGRPDRASQEEQLVRLLRADPAKVDAQEKALNTDMARILPKQ